MNWIDGNARYDRRRISGLLKRFSLATARLLGAWLAVCLVIALCVEGVSRLLFPYVPPTPWDYRRAQPPAYQAAPYFSPAFVDEAFSHQNWLVLPNSRVIYPGDYQGRWFNVKDGIRRTVGSPQTNRRILLVGSSTIYNADVPDDFTIASYLQKLINDRGTGAFAVTAEREI